MMIAKLSFINTLGSNNGAGHLRDTKFRINTCTQAAVRTVNEAICAVSKDGTGTCMPRPVLRLTHSSAPLSLMFNPPFLDAAAASCAAKSGKACFGSKNVVVIAR
mmetsp:Transcript_6262/g.10388  ORF Transcript_6262/g.10388 Transcript_6262/m.10388 type:complete len:105 (+) Transcript_6262:69-383(+)